MISPTHLHLFINVYLDFCKKDLVGYVCIWSRSIMLILRFSRLSEGYEGEWGQHSMKSVHAGFKSYQYTLSECMLERGTDSYSSKQKVGIAA